MDAPVRRCKRLDCPKCRRGRGRPKSWNEVRRHDLKDLASVEDMAHDRSLWRCRIKVMDRR